MSLRKIFLFLAVAAFAAATAQAQFGVYGTFTASKLSGIKTSPEATTPGAVNNDVSPLGGGGGIYYDFLKLGPVKLGADLRGTIATTKRGAYINANGGGARVNSALGGVRVVFNAPVLHRVLRPYVQGSAGIGNTNYGLLYGSDGVKTKTNFEYMGFAGVDIPLLPIMDFRLVEFGIGDLNPFGDKSHNYPLQTVSTGVVFHFPF
ncbi:MAG TPA: outer membrane beta-barrel protein [Edaphobacter sp.]|nr:outer membrane beta-barrel protein [Edaphobacter sp.]